MRYKRTAVAVLTLICLTGLLPSSPAAAQPVPSPALLVPAVRPSDAKEPLRQADPGTVLRSRYVVANVDAVTLAAAGDRTVELPLFDDTKVTTTAAGIEGDAANLAWRGPVSRQGRSVGTLTMSVIGRYLYAIVIADGRLYRIEPVGAGVHAVYELDPDGLPEDGPSPEAHGETPRDQPDEGADGGGGSGGAITSVNGTEGIPGSPPIDVLVVYTAAARGAVTDIRSNIRAAVNDANITYANSGITQRLRLVDAREVGYGGSGNTSDDLDRLIDLDTYMDEVHGWRDSLGADLVQLWATGYNTGGPGVAKCGRGRIQASVGATFESSAFSVMDVTCQANLTMPHELGHNMGARHDWYIDSNNNSPYTYNHGHTNTAGHWRTVMAYPDACNPNCLRVPYFSNPDVTYLGSATGVPEGQSGAADNRKTLNNTALVTNAFRSISVGDGTKADINGDGRDDVLSFQQGGTGQVWGATSNGSTFNTPTHWNPWGAFSYNGHVPAVGDLNGDGRDDMLNFQQGPGTGGEVWAALSNGTTFNTPTRWNPWGAFSYTGHLPAVGDVNGDGRADIVNFQQSNGQVWVALSNGSSFNTPTLWNPWGAFSYEGHVPRVGDVNGDGKADMVNFQRDAGGSVWVALSNGTTFNTPGQWGSGTAFSFRKATPRLGDVNGDGRADAVNFRQGTSGQVFVGLSTGSGFSPGVEWNPWGAFSYIANVPFTADLNGDGKADILNFQQGSNGQIWGATANLLGTQFNLPTHWNPWGPFSYGGSVPI